MTAPPICIDIIEESDVTPEIDAAIRDCLCVCFPADAPVFAKSRPWHGAVPQFSIVARQAHEVVGHVGIVVRTIRAGARQVEVAGVQNMAVRPALRGSGLGGKLITGAMRSSASRAIPFGLLFCVPALERYYVRYGWTLHPGDVRMNFEGDTDIPIPGKNVCMVNPLGVESFPKGPIHLQGSDW